MKTGNESDLSAPISFDGLETVEMHFLENAKNQEPLDDQTIRVSLGAAVRFISSLEKRVAEALLASSKPVTGEEASDSSNSYSDFGSDIDLKKPPSALKHANYIFRKAARHKFENDPDIRDAFQRLTLGTDKYDRPFQEYPHEMNRYWI